MAVNLLQANALVPDPLGDRGCVDERFVPLAQEVISPLAGSWIKRTG